MLQLACRARDGTLLRNTRAACRPLVLRHKVPNRNVSLFFSRAGTAHEVGAWLRDVRNLPPATVANFKGVDGLMLLALSLEDFVDETGLPPLASTA